MGRKVISLNCALLSGGGRVMLDIAEVARDHGYEYHTFTPGAGMSEPIDHHFFSSAFEHRLNVKIGQLSGIDSAVLGCGTRNFLRLVRKLNPDIVHLHGLHNWCINYGILMGFLRETELPTVWTQHDCWSFTGKCPYYTVVGCDKWKYGCFSCPQLKAYPQSMILDNSEQMHNLKKKAFLDMPNMTLVAVSKWMQSQLSQSFLRDYPTVVIENGIDTDAFSYRESALRDQYGLDGKFCILGVADGWSKRKGLADIIELSRMLADEQRHNFKIVLIGVTAEQERVCNEHNILSLRRTRSVEELAKWYSTADVLFNPSMEESFGLVTAEAMSCGAPVIVYDSTASPEIVDGTPNHCVRPHDIRSVRHCLDEIVMNGREFYMTKNIRKVRSDYDRASQYRKYLGVYENVACTVA